MAEYIEKSAAVVIADYAADEHPYDKDPERPETYSDYNQGWNDACDYIRGKLEAMPVADVAPVRHGEWIVCGDGDNVPWMCSHCGKTTASKYKMMYGKYCPNCGIRMDGDKNA